MYTSHMDVKSSLSEYKSEQKSDYITDTFLNTYFYCSIEAIKACLGKKNKKAGLSWRPNTPSAFSSVVCNYNEY